MPASPTLHREQEFEEMVRKHDLTYFYSDDRRSYHAGKASLARIEEAARSLPREVAVRIWNKVVDEKVSDPYRASLHWKE